MQHESMDAIGRSPVGKSGAKPVRERVYLYLREQILRGVFAGGSFIEEGQISAALGVSRTPVREAFHRLEAERFIDLPPRRGALVRQVTAQDLADVYETRRVIEGYAIGRICQQEIPIPDEMEAILDRHDAAPRDDYYTRVELNRQFHFTMIALLGNQVMTDLYKSLDSRQQRVAMRALSVDPNRISRISAEHRALLAALRARDEPEARIILDQHLRPVMGVVSRLPG